MPLPDRGLEFGDGLFETLLVHGSEPLFPRLHLQRLQRGLDTLGFPSLGNSVESQVLRAIAASGEDTPSEGAATSAAWSALRVTVTRGAGPRGYAPPDHANPRILIQITPLQRDCAQMAAAVRVGVAPIALPTQPALTGLKHLNRLEHVLAAQQARERGLDDLLMLDQAGHVVCAVAGNVFIVRDGVLVTPPLVDCGVAGTRRRLVIERWAPACGLSAVESTLTLQDVLAADEVFFTNSLNTVRPVAQLDDRLLGSSVVADALFAQFRSSLR